MHKVEGSGFCYGDPMPKTGGVTPADVSVLRNWITEGALQ
jgi:hypothetical protein